MRRVASVFVFLSVVVLHTALSASLQSAEKEDIVAPHDGLTDLQKIDQMEFEAAQKNEATQMNVTEGQSEDVHYLEAVQDESEEEHVESKDEDHTAEGGGNSDAAAHEESESASSEEAEGRQRREHHEPVTETVSSLDEVVQDSTQEQDVLE